MSREYLVTSVAAHAESVRINNTNDPTLNDPLAYRMQIVDEFAFVSERLNLLQDVMCKKNMGEKCEQFPLRLPSLNWNYRFRCFFNSQFRTVERIASLVNIGIPVQDIELEPDEAVYQQDILYNALSDLFEASKWFAAYAKSVHKQH